MFGKARNNPIQREIWADFAQAENDKNEYFDSLIENNQYTDHKNAEYSITERFEGIAHEQCEGAYNCGEELFEQRYQIAGNPNTFEATVKFEYNRHDKTYYYIDGTDYSYVQLQPNAA